MKILLLNPPLWNEYGSQLNFNQGTGLTYLGAVLRKVHDVKIIDADALRLDYPTLEQYIISEKPNVVIVTATTLSYPSMIKTVQIAKRYAKVIIGGPHVSALPERSLNETGANIAIVGEGEDVIEKAVSQATGIEVNRIISERIITGTQPDIDLLAFPARDLAIPRVGSEGYIGNEPRLVKPEAVICSMRGCVHRCIFCSHPIYKRQKTRRRNPRNVVDEIELLKTEYGIKSIFFYDDEWIGQSEAQNKWIIDVCDEIINRGHNDIIFKTQGRCSEKYVTNSVIDSMWAANFRFIMLGCESGSDEVLIANKKDTTVADIKHTVKLLHEKRISVWTFWMVGMPYATIKDEQMTQILMDKLSPFIDHTPQVTVCSPLPGSEMWELYEKNGWLITTDFSKYNQYNITFNNPWMTSEEITRWRNILIDTWKKYH